MAKYKYHSYTHKIDLCTTNWFPDTIDEEDCDDAKAGRWIAISPACLLAELFNGVNPLYPEGYAKYVCLYYTYADDDGMELHPIATCLTYPAYEPSGSDDVPDYDYDNEVELSKKEVEYFSTLLQEAIGDKHSAEMQKVMTNYHNSVDRELKAFVKDVMQDREILPLTVGFVNEKMAEEIKELMNTDILGERIVIDTDGVAKTLVIHGSGSGDDRSMKDADDIARLCYVLANYDTIIRQGNIVWAVTKKIGDRTYVVELKEDLYYKNRVKVAAAYITDN